ncbi:zinc metalloprotease [Sphingomonas sp. HDW15A]|uniref:KPN_02809 family neutral zinc metallopeptidase n=1 Tax=Sphingomonas sp. HDW15A TaxID=2714942 RepID=UPI00140849A9|nr:neutral zinc metallopeptidase [Sphingomonas sp. HDW15A]QIK95394.1 zinc metalloprotease [Sphingomonas sp. HDW15A]
MRFDGPGSSNFEDRTGQSGGLSLGGGGGGLFGLLFQIVASKFGIVGILILALGYCALTQMGGSGGVVGQKEGPSRLDPATGQFMTQVLGSTEQVWGELFRQAGGQYKPTTLVAYSNANQSGCGAAQAAMGPFYCPTDQKIYIDPQFFDELSRRFQAPGDAAAAYVIAHEVGHHIQNLEGTLDRARTAQASSSEVAGNQIQVGVELQADCYAGVWAARSGALEAGDIEEGMRAAEAIGDDTLQKQTQGRIVPESFTHGSSAQRMEALQRGLKSGNPAACNYAR